MNSGIANRQVGEFVLEQKIGEGEAATVYRAYQPTVNRYVALKIILPPYPAHGEAAENFERRFIQEAQALAALEHPHIVPIYHFGVVEEGSAYIAMRLMRTSLKELLATGPLNSQRVTEIILQLIEGLSYAHRKGVLHQDIKPQNILFDEAGSACLADFGLARVTDRSMDTSRPNFLLETAIYVPPERFRSTYVDPRSDIYSLGVVMYQMLTGCLPFETENSNLDVLLRKIESEEPLSPRKINAQIEPELERVILRSLRKEPRERFFDVNEMAEALEAVPGTRLKLHRPQIDFPARGRKMSLSRRQQVRLIIALLMVGVVMFSILIISKLRENSQLQPASIEAATFGSVSEIEPAPGEIAQAQRVLGNDGFIAYVTCGMDSQFQSARAREMNDYAQADGLAYRVYDSENDDYKQLTLIEQARLEGAKAIILCPLSPDVLSSSLTSVEQANIPLVLTDALTESYGGVMLSQDDHNIGLLAGRYIGQTLTTQGKRSAQVVILDATEYPSSEGRIRGFLDGLEENIPNTQIVAQLDTGASQEESRASIASLINKQHFDAIFSVSDTGTYGAIDALATAHIAPDDVVIASVNAESLALDYIAHDNYLRATVDVGLDASSRGAFNAAVKLLGGGKLAQILTLPPGNLITRDIIKGQTPGN